MQVTSKHLMRMIDVMTRWNYFLLFVYFDYYYFYYYLSNRSSSRLKMKRATTRKIDAALFLPLRHFRELPPELPVFLISMMIMMMKIFLQEGFSSFDFFFFFSCH